MDKKFNWNKILKEALRMRKSDFMKEMLQRREDQGSKSPMGSMDCAILYAITRWQCPKVIVETGGFLGMSSAFILKALQDAEVTDVKLYSMEKMKDCPHGILIPDYLKAPFIPLTGRVEEFMKKGQLPAKIDMFLHDSSHRLKHMLMEFEHFWKCLGDGGLLMSHDVDMTAAFTEFVTKTYQHDAIGQSDPKKTEHHVWGRVGKLGFMIKKA